MKIRHLSGTVRSAAVAVWEAAELMREAEAWLREQGVAKLNLMVRHSNSAAVQFYERLGHEDGHVTVLGRWLT